MAKVINPFFSLAASGTAGGINIQPTDTRSIARRAARPPTTAPSAIQISARNKFSDASEAWKNLDPEQKDVWRSISITPRHTGGLQQTAPYYNGHAHFIREYILQQISPPNLPLVPAR